jgi:hypothetical protein
MVCNNNRKQGPRKDISDITCHRYGEKGRCANECKNEERQSGANMLMAGVASGKFDDLGLNFYRMGTTANHMSATLNQPSGYVPKEWILLDNQSTLDVFYNQALLTNMHCDVEVMSTNMIVDRISQGRPIIKLFDWLLISIVCKHLVHVIKVNIRDTKYGH